MLQFRQTTSADTLQSFTVCTVLPQRRHFPWKKASASSFLGEALFGRWFLAWLRFCAFWVDSTPDTGCTITLLNYDLALRNGIHIDRTKKIELYHAAGGSMHVEEMANIRVCANNIQATLRVAVSSELKENVLISCDDLRKLRVIPADFPNTVLAVHQTNKLAHLKTCLLYTSPSPRDRTRSRMPSSA